LQLEKGLPSRMAKPAQHLKTFRESIIVNGTLAMRTERLKAAREGRHGVQVMAIEHMAERLAGGFLKMPDMPTLKKLISEVLPETDLGELEPIKNLPGFVAASAATLTKLWHSDSETIGQYSHPRIDSLRELEKAVVAAMPANVRKPEDIIALAIERARHARAIFGKVVLKGMTDVHPVWRPLLIEMGTYVNVVWDLGPRKPLPWMGALPTRNLASACTPTVSGVSCASARHEAVEAARWVRSLLAGGVDASEIAVATVSTSAYDEFMIAVDNASQLGFHFTHGIPAVNTREGQAAAALADLMLRGLTQKKVRRFVDLVGPGNGPFASLPEDWPSVMKEDAALAKLERWELMLSRSHDPKLAKVRDVLLPFLRIVSKGAEAAREIGGRFLDGKALALWNRGLVNGPAEALDRTLRTLKTPDGRDPASSPCYMSAEDLAASPRKYVRLLGLTSRNWPRRPSEDALIPDHIIPSAELDPMPVSALDRTDYATIMATTEKEVVLSWPRRDAEGRALSISSLVPENIRKKHGVLRLTGTPGHAMSESDRLFARPQDYSALEIARSAAACWADWNSKGLTPHDGLFPANHPRISKVFGQYQSATSIRMLLRDPLGFVWKYALGFHVPEYEDEPLAPDPREFGNIVHSVLRRVVETLGRRDCYAHHTAEEIRKAVGDAAYDVARYTQTAKPVPPELVWRSMMDKAERFATTSLVDALPPLDGQISYAEVPFGGNAKWEREDLPWDPHKEVFIPGTGLKLNGFIDRIDLSGNHSSARVIDYKTGKVPKKLPDIVIGGGSEIQRCIYGYAVRTLLGEQAEIESGLFYPSEGEYAPLPDMDATLDAVANAVSAAKTALENGKGFPGIDARESYNDVRFALPSNHSAGYLARKWDAILESMGEAAEVWTAD